MTRAIKVNIEKEEVGYWGPQFREVKVPPMQIISRGSPMDLPPINVEEVVYDIAEVWNPELKEKEIFYVKTSDRKLFESLIRVTDAFIKKQVYELFGKYERNEEAIKKQIRSLPWYKRLFNKF